MGRDPAAKSEEARLRLTVPAVSAIEPARTAINVTNSCAFVNDHEVASMVL